MMVSLSDDEAAISDTLAHDWGGFKSDTHRVEEVNLVTAQSSLDARSARYLRCSFFLLLDVL